MKNFIPIILFNVFFFSCASAQTVVDVTSMKQELAKPFYLGKIHTDYSVMVYCNPEVISKTFLKTFEGLRFESMYGKEIKLEDFYKGVRMNKIAPRGTYLYVFFDDYKNPNKLSFPEGSWLIEIKANP